MLQKAGQNVDLLVSEIAGGSPVGWAFVEGWLTTSGPSENLDVRAGFDPGSGLAGVTAGTCLRIDRVGRLALR